MFKLHIPRQWTQHRRRLWQQLNTKADQWPQILYQAAIEFSEHEGFMSAAAIAYYAFLSLFPLSILLLAITRRLLEPAEALTRYNQLMNHYLPGATDFLQVTYAPLQGQLSLLRVVAVLTLIWAGSGIFAVTGRLLDRAWRIKQRGSLWLRRRLIALPMALSALILITASLAGSTVLQLLLRLEFLNGIGWLTHAISTALFLILNVLLFALAYWSLPSAQIEWHDVIPGSILASILWEGAKIGFTAYLSHLRLFNVVYGSVTAIVAFLLWAYLGGCIVLFCGELNAEYGRHRHVEELLKGGTPSRKKKK
jgi:membrane protein